jgi:recombinational DNA repair protein (RecF pathway)
MAEKQIVFSAQEQQQIEAIVIDQDKLEAVKYLAELVQRFKGTEGHACGPKPAK